VNELQQRRNGTETKKSPEAISAWLKARGLRPRQSLTTLAPRPATARKHTPFIASAKFSVRNRSHAHGGHRRTLISRARTNHTSWRLPGVEGNVNFKNVWKKIWSVEPERRAGSTRGACHRLALSPMPWQGTPIGDKEAYLHPCLANPSSVKTHQEERAAATPPR